MANTRTKWTKEEDEILVQAIKANPHNKAKAFREVAEKVNHSEICCSGRWYKYCLTQSTRSMLAVCLP